MKKIWHYVITFAICTLLSFLILLSKDVFHITDTNELFKALTDSFFAVGVIMACIGLLIVATNEGTFDIIVYGTRKFIDLFRKQEHRRVHETFYDYRVAMSKKKSGFWHLVIVGGFFIMISMCFLYFYFYTLN